MFNFKKKIKPCTLINVELLDNKIRVLRLYQKDKLIGSIALGEEHSLALEKTLHKVNNIKIETIKNPIPPIKDKHLHS